MKKFILVTGGAGFIGSKLCSSLYSKGYTVIACDDLSNGKKKNLLNEIEFLKLDISKENLNVLKVSFIHNYFIIIFGCSWFDSYSILIWTQNTT